MYEYIAIYTSFQFFIELNFVYRSGIWILAINYIIPQYLKLIYTQDDLLKFHVKDKRFVSFTTEIPEMAIPKIKHTERSSLQWIRMGIVAYPIIDDWTVLFGSV